MAQVAMALSEESEPPEFERLEFRRPVVIGQGRTAVIQVAALVREPGMSDVVLRTDATSFSDRTIFGTVSLWENPPWPRASSERCQRTPGSRRA